MIQIHYQNLCNLKLNPWIKKIFDISSIDTATPIVSIGSKANDKDDSGEIEREEEHYNSRCNEKTLIVDDNL